MADIFPCENVELLGHLQLDQIGHGDGNDSWGWKDPQTQRYYALVGRSSGTAFVDITTPSNPVYVGNLATESEIDPIRDIKTYKNFALVIADSSSTMSQHINQHGLQVFDLTRLRSVNNTPQEFSADAVYSELLSAHNIAVNEASGYAYVIGSKATMNQGAISCNGGLHIINLRDPFDPTFAGCFGDDGYIHDTQCVIYDGLDEDYQGKEICFASAEDTLNIIDVSDKSNSQLVSRNLYSQSQYTHQGWLTEDHRYFLLDDEYDEGRLNSNTRTHIWDMADLDNPQHLGFHLADIAVSDHNQYIVGNYVYQANYTGGMRILELTDLANTTMTEVAFFDTHPEANNHLFEGAWTAFPFFDNGLVIVSDINRGVFILRPNLGTTDETIIIDNFDSP